MANKFGVQPFNSPVEPTMDYAKIAPLIGVQSPRHPPHDRVTAVDVDRWCQVMRDTNPLYTDEEYARQREVIAELVNALVLDGGRSLEPWLRRKALSRRAEAVM